MTPEQTWLSAITLAPPLDSWGWRFVYVPEQRQLAVCICVPDTNGEAPMVTMEALPVPVDVTQREFYLLAFELVGIMVLHEGAEAFRVNGERILNPHDKTKRPPGVMGGRGEE